MESLLKQLGALFATGITGACCLGLPIIVTALGSVGLGFLINDLILLPLFYGFLALNLWMLYRRRLVHARRGPFWLAGMGAVLAGVTLWTPYAVVVYVGLFAIVVGSVWDFILARKRRLGMAC